MIAKAIDADDVWDEIELLRSKVLKAAIRQINENSQISKDAQYRNHNQPHMTMAKTDNNHSTTTTTTEAAAPKAAAAAK